VLVTTVIFTGIVAVANFVIAVIVIVIVTNVVVVITFTFSPPSSSSSPHHNCRHRRHNLHLHRYHRRHHRHRRRHHHPQSSRSAGYEQLDNDDDGDVDQLSLKTSAPRMTGDVEAADERRRLLMNEVGLKPFLIVLFFLTALVLTVLIFSTELVLGVLIVFTALILTRIFPTGLVLAFLIFPTELLLLVAVLKVIYCSMTLIVTFYVTVGFFGYLQFGMDIQGNVLNSFGITDNLINVARVCICCLVCIPLFLTVLLS
jgi:hypothetical protein